jgi:hypothetical protein
MSLEIIVILLLCAFIAGLLVGVILGKPTIMR